MSTMSPVPVRTTPKPREMNYIYLNRQVKFICNTCALKFAKKKTVNEDSHFIDGRCDFCQFDHKVTGIENYSGLDTSVEGITIKKEQ